MNINAILSVIIVVVLFPCSAGAVSSHSDKIVAVVNRGVITQSELNKKTAIARKQQHSVTRQQVLDGLIDTTLQLQLAKSSGVQISDKELDAVIANIAKDHNVTISQLKQLLAERDRVSFNDFRNQIREQGLIRKVQQQFLGKEIKVDEKEVMAVLHNPPKISSAPIQYHVVDILLEEADNSSVEQQKLVANVAKQMAAKLRSGKQAEDVVKEGQQKIDDKLVQYNDLGWRKLDEMPALFAKEVVKMNANQVVGPFKAPNGLHLIKLLGTNGAQSMKFTKNQAYEIVYQRKISEKLKPWLVELRAAAYIKIVE